MTLSDLAALGSFLNGIAVVATLAFLLAQLRQANKNQKALLQQGRSSRVTELILRMTQPELSRVLARTGRGDLDIEDSQVGALTAFYAAVFWSIEDSFLQYRAGLLPANSWETDLATLRRFLSGAACRVAWTMAREMMCGEYRDYVDALMREIVPRAPTDTLKTWQSLMSRELGVAA